MESLAIFGILGFSFAATTSGVLVYERQSDVLSYIERRERSHAVSATFVFARAIAEAVVEHLNWKARDAVYPASLA